MLTEINVAKITNKHPLQNLMHSSGWERKGTWCLNCSSTLHTSGNSKLELSQTCAGSSDGYLYTYICSREGAPYFREFSFKAGSTWMIKMEITPTRSRGKGLDFQYKATNFPFNSFPRSWANLNSGLCCIIPSVRSVFMNLCSAMMTWYSNGNWSPKGKRLRAPDYKLEIGKVRFMRRLDYKWNLVFKSSVSTSQRILKFVY